MKILSFLFALLLLASCVTKTLAPTDEVVEENTNFVDSYVDTLEESVSDARDVANTMNQKQGELEKGLEGVEE